MQKKLLTKFNIHLWLKKKKKNPKLSKRWTQRTSTSTKQRPYTKIPHHCWWWKSESLSSKIRKKTRRSTLTAFFQYSFGNSSQGIQRKKINKKNPNWKIRSKGVCRWHDTLYIENPKDATRKLLSSVQSLSHVRFFETPWIAVHQASLSITNSRCLFKLMSIKSVIPSSHLIFCCPLLFLPPIPPSIRVFSNESTLHVRWPKY